MSAAGVLRRDLLAFVGAALCGACGSSKAPATTAGGPSSDEPLLLDPLVGIVAAAGLQWLIEARPHELLASPALVPAFALLFPPARFSEFAARYGGIDLREVSELGVASYPGATLALARVPVEPRRMEAAFRARAQTVDERVESRGVTRLSGSVGQAREQIAVFGREAVGLEHGRPGPLRAAAYFAERRLARALPALAAAPLADAAEMLGRAPLRAFAPGPFEGAWAKGLGGLLRVTTALAVGAWPVLASATGTGDAGAGVGGLRFTAVLTGAWGSDAAAAGQRLKGAFDALMTDPLGRLSGLDRPMSGPQITAEHGALRLDVTLGALALARGLYDVTSATVDEVMAY
jgi:hypothetical protein